MRARVFAVMALTALPLGALAASAGQVQDEMRFRGMDRNGDGRISRAEWRGSAQSFRQHDWNGDGVLSGDEVRPNAQRNRDMPSDDRFGNTRPEFDDWTAEGFTYLDRNRDGRITRNEWYDDRALFQRADRNGDNVLSRSEFLGFETADSPREERFESLDTNNNGRIERGEWRGRADRFDTLDRNNDGVVTRGEMLGVGDARESQVFTSADGNRDNRLSQSEWQWSRREFMVQDRDRNGYVEREEFSPPDDTTGTSGQFESPVVVNVSGTQAWTDTGINVRAGDVLRVTSTGTVRLSGNWNDSASPGGANRRAANSPMPNHPAGALIARIGNGAPFFIGDGTNINRTTNSGRLYLGVNDDHLPDNSGAFRVTVGVRGQ